MSPGVLTPSGPSKIDLTALTPLRPAEIKTYHQKTYERISPSTTYYGKEKTVPITGGASGIGLSIAESFVKVCVQHLVLMQRRQEVSIKTKDDFEAKYPKTKVTTYTASVIDFDRISAILKEVGKIDILVLNVATSHPFVPSGEISTADYELNFDTNVVGTFHITKEFLTLQSTGPRVVINVSSASGQIVQPGNISYGPSKAAGGQVIQHFAQEYAGTDVTFQTFHLDVIRIEYAAKLPAEDGFDWEDRQYFTNRLWQLVCLVTLPFGLLVRKPASLPEGSCERNGM